MESIDSGEGASNSLMYLSTWMFVGRSHRVAVAVTRSVSFCYCAEHVAHARTPHLRGPARETCVFPLIPLCPMSGRYPKVLMTPERVLEPSHLSMK